MKLATIRAADGNHAVRVDGDALVDLGYADLDTLLSVPQGLARAAEATGVTYDLESAQFAPLIHRPSKVICVGHNYSNHIKEMGREPPAYPTLFPKFADSLLGANDPIVKPPESNALDWEVELVIVIGQKVRRANEAEAEAAIAGFSVMNDISARDWQFRTVEWTQGKIWDSSTPVGPYLVTPDALGGVRPALDVRTVVDGELMQHDNTKTLLFDPVFLVRYISTIVKLRPGDLIATGTPAGVGHARDPKVYLKGGEEVRAEIEGIGACVNRVVLDE